MSKVGEVVDYIVLEHANGKLLEKEVKAGLANGYRLHGDHYVQDNKHTQVIIKLLGDKPNNG